MSKKVETEVKLCKGVSYELVKDKVVIHQPEGDVTLPLELGRSAYSVVFQHLNRKTGKSRVKGVNRVGNFFYAVEGSVMTISREGGEVVATRELTEAETKYPRNAAINSLLETLK